MPVVTLRAPLKDLAGGTSSRGRGRHRRRGAAHARVAVAQDDAGWILDEQGAVRRHVNVFLNGERSTRRTRLRPRTSCTSCHRSQEERHARTARRHQEGTVRPAGRAAGLATRSRRERSPATSSSTRCATRGPGGTSPRVTSGFYGPRVMHDERSRRRVGAGRGLAFPESDDVTRRADLGHQAGRGRRAAVGRHRSGGAVGIARRRRHVGAETRPVEGAGSQAIGSPGAAGWRCTPSVPGRATRDGSRSACRRRACGLPRTAARPGAPATRGSSPTTCPRKRARDERVLHPQHASVARSARSAVHAVPRRRVPERRRRLVVERHRRGSPGVVRLPDRDRSGRPDSAFVIPMTGAEDRIGPRRHRCACSGRATPGSRGRVRARVCRRAMRSSRSSARPSTRTARGRRLGLCFGATIGRGLRLDRRGRIVVHGRAAARPGDERPRGLNGACQTPWLRCLTWDRSSRSRPTATTWCSRPSCCTGWTPP